MYICIWKYLACTASVHKPQLFLVESSLYDGTDRLGTATGYAHKPLRMFRSQGSCTSRQP